MEDVAPDMELLLTTSTGVQIVNRTRWETGDLFTLIERAAGNDGAFLRRKHQYDGLGAFGRQLVVGDSLRARFVVFVDLPPSYNSTGFLLDPSKKGFGGQHLFVRLPTPAMIVASQRTPLDSLGLVCDRISIPSRLALMTLKWISINGTGWYGDYTPTADLPPVEIREAARFEEQSAATNSSD